MTPRRCSHCGNNGHNSRTCRDRKGCLKLFGVQIWDNHLHDEKPIRRSLSMNQHMLMMMHINNCNNVGNNDHHHGDDGYLSDGLTEHSSCKPQVVLRRRKKGMPWTEEEHKTFLIGLKKLGRGDWRGISKNFVHTRTPTQVASHAQKYFMRQLSAKDMKKKKSRLSLFDLPLYEDFSPNSTSPCPSPLFKESPPQNLNGSSDSSDHADFQASGLPYMSCSRSDILRLENFASQAADTSLQLGLPSFTSSNAALMSSMVDDMLELRIALPVGLHSN